MDKKRQITDNLTYLPDVLTIIRITISNEVIVKIFYCHLVCNANRKKIGSHSHVKLKKNHYYKNSILIYLYSKVHSQTDMT